MKLIRINDKTHKLLKVLAAKQEKTIVELLDEIIYKYINEIEVFDE